MGLARNGSYAGNSSGDIFIAFSTANAAALEETAGTGLDADSGCRVGPVCTATSGAGNLTR